MQGFFELRPRRPGRQRPPVRRPAWLGPPGDSFGVVVPLHLVLVRTADLAVAIPGATAYGNGFSFDLAIRRAVAEDEPFEMERALYWFRREGPPPPEVLRVGVQFADGQKATNLDNWWDDSSLHDPQQAPPPGPVLHLHGGGGGERVWDQSCWVWPLPPDGPLTFVVEWPAHGVPLTQARVEAAMIRQAATQDERLWPADFADP
jgi:hypothetical protein